MPEPIDRASYLKGGEDAMHSVTGEGIAPVPAAAPPEPPDGIPSAVPATPAKRGGPAGAGGSQRGSGP
jgi:hypothetical protein